MGGANSSWEDLSQAGHMYKAGKYVPKLAKRKVPELLDEPDEDESSEEDSDSNNNNEEIMQIKEIPNITAEDEKFLEELRQQNSTQIQRIWRGYGGREVAKERK